MTDELKRRLVHASGSGLVVLYLLSQYLELGLTWNRFRVLMLVFAIGALVLEFVRLRVGLDWWIYEKLTREYERDQIAGYGLYMLSMAAVVLAFPPRIALPSMLMLALADPISGALSDDTLRQYKRPRVFVAMFAVCTLIAYPFLPLGAAVAAAVGAAIADGVTVRVRSFVLDDNLTIPVYAAVLAYVAVATIPL